MGTNCRGACREAGLGLLHLAGYWHVCCRLDYLHAVRVLGHRADTGGQSAVLGYVESQEGRAEAMIQQPSNEDGAEFMLVAAEQTCMVQPVDT